MWILVLGLVIFLGIHSTRMVVPSVREDVIANRGENGWKLPYTIISIVGFLVLIWGYGQARVDTSNLFLYSAPVWLSHLQLLLMLPAMILLVASQAPTGYIATKVKNPMLLAVKVWALAHLLVNGDLASLLLFGTFLVWAVLLVINTNRRPKKETPDPKAIGDVIAIVGGIALWVLFIMWLHEWLFGVAVIAT